MRDIFVGAAYFNSHPHEEDDFIRRSLLGTCIYFNSHPHEEDDLATRQKFLTENVFQLTSSRRG